MARSTVLRITKAPDRPPGGLSHFILHETIDHLDPGQWLPKIRW
jgi:hypothetical protein